MLDSCELLPNHKPLRKWTDAEIMEAKSIVADGLFEISKTGYFHLVPIDDGGQVTLDFCGKTYFSNCCESDEWNIWIGRMEPRFFGGSTKAEDIGYGVFSPGTQSPPILYIGCFEST